MRQISSTDELRDDFTGMGSFSVDPDISTGSYLKKLHSIYERLELLPAPRTRGASNDGSELSSTWALIHPSIREVAESRFNFSMFRASAILYSGLIGRPMEVR